METGYKDVKMQRQELREREQAALVLGCWERLAWCSRVRGEVSGVGFLLVVLLD